MMAAFRKNSSFIIKDIPNLTILGCYKPKLKYSYIKFFYYYQSILMNSGEYFETFKPDIL
jgi:hypothetical protein